MKQLKRSEQLAFLSSDVKILETLFASQKGEWLELDGKYMPDGEVFKISLAGVKEMTNDLRKQIVSTVRDQFDARETEQAAKAASAAAAREAASGGGDTSTADRGGGPVATSAAVPEPEKSLQESLEERQESLIQRLAKLSESLEERQRQYDALFDEYEGVQLCIDALQKSSPSTSTTKKQKGGRAQRKSG